MQTPHRSLVLTLLLGACAAESTTQQGAVSGPDGVSYAGGDGSSCEQAVIPQGVKGEFDGVGSEYAWLKAKYPGSKPKGQGLTKCNGKPADRITIVTADGAERQVYFDISGFFGKM